MKIATTESRREVDVPVTIDTTEVQLRGDLFLPSRARSIVVFAHGSGSSRHSPRNRQVARVFYEAGFAALLFDLLTEQEEREEEFTAHHRFDILLLTERLRAALRWVRASSRIPHEAVGLFGASTGAAAALVTAAEDGIATVVSRGGRPDLAGESLTLVGCPVLLIVGGDDTAVLTLNERAARKLRFAQIEIVPHASHLFSERGALERVAELSRDWFEQYLISPGKER